MQQLLRTDDRIFACALLAALVVYGDPITNYAVHIDAELAIAIGSANYDVALGRWGTGLVRLFLSPEPTAPFFQPLLSVALLAAAGVGVAAAVGTGPVQRGVCAILFVAFPQFAYQLEFPKQSDCVALGLLCAALSVPAWGRAAGPRRWAYAGATLGLNALAFSFYPTIVFVPATAVLCWGLARLLTTETSIGRIVADVSAFLGVVLLGYLCTFGIGRAVQALLGIQPDPGYLARFVGWGALPRSVVLARSLDAFGAVLTGRDYDGDALYATVWLAIAAIVVRCWRARLGRARRIVVALFAVAAALMPASIVLVLGLRQEARAFLGQNVAFATLWALALGPSVARRRVAALLLVGGSLAFGCQTVSALFQADTMALAADENAGGRIMTDIYAADPAFDPRVTPVFFAGAYRAPNVWTPRRAGAFGGSFLSWDNGDPVRVVAFLKVSGIADLMLPDYTKWPVYRRAAAGLPVWPNPNAARLIDGVMIVRLGD